MQIRDEVIAVNTKTIFVLLTILVLLSSCVEVEEEEELKEDKKVEEKTTKTDSTTQKSEVKSETKTEDKKEQSSTQNSTLKTELGEGTLFIGVTDKAQDMKDISSIKVTISSASVHNKGKNSLFSVTKGPTTFDLLELKNRALTQLLGEAKLESGIYDQINLYITNVDVTIKTGQKEAKLPSNTLKIKGDIEIKPGETSTVVLDFIADKSLHQTGAGRIILAPVIRLETKTGAEAKISGSTLEVKGGEVKTSKTIGMKSDGDFVEGEESLDPTAELSYENNKVIEGKSDIGKEQSKFYKSIGTTTTSSTTQDAEAKKREQELLKSNSKGSRERRLGSYNK